MRRRGRALAFGAAALAVGALALSSLDVEANNPQVVGDPTSNTTARFPAQFGNSDTFVSTITP